MIKHPEFLFWILANTEKIAHEIDRLLPELELHHPDPKRSCKTYPKHLVTALFGSFEMEDAIRQTRCLELFDDLEIGFEANP